MALRTVFAMENIPVIASATVCTAPCRRRNFVSSLSGGKRERRGQVLCLVGKQRTGDQTTVAAPKQRRPSRRQALRSICAAASGEAAAEPSFPLPSSTDEAASVSLPQKVLQFQAAFWKFLRPHTIRGTVLGTVALVSRALLENPQAIQWALLPRALRGLLALLCGNGYIVGINQIYDYDIDKVNKPFLPVAAGEMSPTTAWLLCATLGVAGLAIVATNFGSLITILYSFGLFLGTIYSASPLRLKRFPLPAFLIIATVRGFLLNFGVFYATRAALNLPFQWSPAILFITSFVTVFATVIAITKDLSDVEGDRKYQIKTFATQVGVRAVACLGAGLLVANYTAAIVAALRLPHAFRPLLMIGGHAVLAVSVVYQTWLLDSTKYSMEGVAAFYRFIWNLFYLEYAMLPFI
eukprot:TRINITY_DN38673_c0_g1_i1.p1 TRINITY_DN38673_c0_g1~~TRINITY_DN38673_c0_g1_i1.p1  ORF type:complete len:409 (+),score=56.38 TRINITY_DN38673_c0_g1_i1:178-1404(+)